MEEKWSDILEGLWAEHLEVEARAGKPAIDQPAAVSSLSALETKGEKPPKRLRPESWTEEEADAFEGKRIRFRNLDAGGLVKYAVGFVDKEGFVYLYALHIVCDSGETIHLSKGDMLTGKWAFEVV